MIKSLLNWSIITFLSFPFHCAVICFSSNIEWYERCGKYFSCGNVTNVGYPFWGGTRPKVCGYPGLEMICEDNATAEIEIMGLKYQVLDINQSAQIVRLARDDLVEGICLDQFESTVLNTELFEYAHGTQNMTVLYGCPAPYDGAMSSPFTCKINGVNETDAYVLEGDVDPSFCNAGVLVPVLETLVDQIGNLSLSQIVRKGFKVKYRVDDDGFCSECEASKGRCLFDPNNNETSCICPDGNAGYPACSKSITAIAASGSGRALTKSQIAIIASTSAVGTGILVILIIYFKRRCLKVLKVSQPREKQAVEAFLRTYGIVGPKRYTYSDLKRITNSLGDKLGAGGYGTVYRGMLHNGHQVAVKILKKSKGDPVAFINEVASIGKTNHKNIVTLLGFCYEGNKQALVYDFMPNGSLDKFIYRGNNHQSLAWEKLFEIVVGIARGLDYLHQGCNTRILHFDIKPHNILLDENFCPKISDFGLAKLCPQKESIVSISGARGTAGYIAPEVFFRGFGGVSQKSDVYSYGMLVLEMVGCRNNSDVAVECSSEQYFPHWIYKQLEQEKEPDSQDILTAEERELWRKMVLVSLWCIQTSPQSRPTMARVAEMLEDTSESLLLPPIPSLASPPRPHLEQNSSTAHTISMS
uniref:non-specific serine/threonine protein kinase n=1 Tax=Opuntia streptacantha TaxID=393608 RepID=A0A7C9AM15_OPUST